MPKKPVFVLFAFMVVMSLLMACVIAGRPAARPTPTPTNPSNQSSLPTAGPLPPGATALPAATSQPEETGVPPTSIAATGEATDSGDQDLQAGKYSGNFNLDLECQSAPVASNGTKVQYTGVIKIQGTVDITVTTPKQAKALISYDASQHLLNAIYYVDNKTGMACSDTVTLSADPTVVMLAPLTDNYDPSAKIFANPVTFSEPQNEQFQIVHSGATWDGRVDIDHKTTQAYLDALLKVVNEIDLQVQNSQEELSGDVSVPNVRSDCTATGKWQAAPLPE